MPTLESLEVGLRHRLDGILDLRRVTVSRPGEGLTAKLRVVIRGWITAIAVIQATYSHEVDKPAKRNRFDYSLS
jgi:hypothetical protein